MTDQQFENRQDQIAAENDYADAVAIESWSLNDSFYDLEGVAWIDVPADVKEEYLRDFWDH